MQTKKIAICIYTTNAAQTLRSVEIAKAVVKKHRQNQQSQNQGVHGSQTHAHDVTISPTVDIIIRFFTYRGCLPGNPPRTIDYEHLITDAGFDVQYFGSADDNNNNSNSDEKERDEHSLAVVDDEMWLAFLDAERKHLGFFPLPYSECATPYIRVIMNTLGTFQPDVVVYGLFPEVAVASAIQGWRTVSYAPVVPSIFRAWVQNRQSLIKEAKNNDNVLAENKPANPWKVIQDAAAACGLKYPSSSSQGQDPRADFFKAIQPNHTIVCDFESYYENERLPPDVTVVGPIIPSDTTNASNTLEELELFLQQQQDIDTAVAPVKTLLTMGSTVESATFIEGLKALCNAEVGTFLSVALIPTTVLHTFSSEADEILQIADSRDDILLVKKFVNARSLTSLVDVVLCHGGQQTIQIALAAGVPIVGRPSHYEQQYNLDNVERCHAGVCISPDDWKEERIRKGITPSGKGIISVPRRCCEGTHSIHE